MALVAGVAQNIGERVRESYLHKVRVGRLASSVRSIIVGPSAVVASAGRVLWAQGGEFPQSEESSVEKVPRPAANFAPAATQCKKKA